MNNRLHVGTPVVRLFMRKNSDSSVTNSDSQFPHGSPTALNWGPIELAQFADLNLSAAEDLRDAMDDDEWEQFCQEHVEARS